MTLSPDFTVRAFFTRKLDMRVLMALMALPVLYGLLWLLMAMF